MSAKAAIQKKLVKKSTADEDGRRRREANLVKIRKEKREEGMQKRRNFALSATAESEQVEAGANAESQNVGQISLDSTGAGGSTHANDASNPGAPASLAVGLSVDNLLNYCQAAMSDDLVQQLTGVSCIRRLLSKESHPPVEPVLQSGILGRLVELLASGDSKIQFEAAWAVTNIASTEYTNHVVQAGAVQPLVACMMAEDPSVREQAIWCCGNIAGDCAKYRDELIGTEGAVDALLRNLQFPETPSLLRNATWALSNLCRGKPSPSEEVVRYVLPALAALVNHTDAEVIQDATWGLSYLTDCDDKIVNAVLEVENIVTRCVELMGSEEIGVIMPALRTVGNLISGKDTSTQAALDAGCLKFLVPLLANPKRNIRREACWAVSNIAAGTSAQIDALMATPGIVPNVVSQLRNGEWNVKKEAAWAISNIAASGSPLHVRTLVEAGVVEPLTEMLKLADVRIMCVVLDTIQNMLNAGNKYSSRGDKDSVADAFEEVGLLDSLEQLQESDNEDIYQKCVDIIERFYGAEDAAAAANTNNNGAGSAAATSNYNGFGLSSNVASNGVAPFTALSANSAASWAFSMQTPPSASAMAGAPCLAVPPPAFQQQQQQTGFNFGDMTFA